MTLISIVTFLAVILVIGAWPTLKMWRRRNTTTWQEQIELLECAEQPTYEELLTERDELREQLSAALDLMRIIVHHQQDHQEEVKEHDPRNHGYQARAYARAAGGARVTRSTSVD